MVQLTITIAYNQEFSFNQVCYYKSLMQSQVHLYYFEISIVFTFMFTRGSI